MEPSFCYTTFTSLLLMLLHNHTENWCLALRERETAEMSWQNHRVHVWLKCRNLASKLQDYEVVVSVLFNRICGLNGGSDHAASRWSAWLHSKSWVSWRHAATMCVWFFVFFLNPSALTSAACVVCIVTVALTLRWHSSFCFQRSFDIPSDEWLTAWMNKWLNLRVEMKIFGWEMLPKRGKIKRNERSGICVMSAFWLVDWIVLFKSTSQLLHVMSLIYLKEIVFCIDHSQLKEP